MLALHPEYQERVFQEILTVMPEKDTELTQAHLDKLEFTDLCIRETLRIFPTAPIIARVASKPIRLSNNVEVPPGVPIVFGIRQIHIRKDYYGPTVNEFNPLRFLDDDVKNLPGGCYIPFSHGARNCIGDLFTIKCVVDSSIAYSVLFCSVLFVLGYFYAKVSVKCCIVHLIRNYRLTTIYKKIDELIPVLNVSMRLVDKHMVKLERRE